MEWLQFGHKRIDNSSFIAVQGAVTKICPCCGELRKWVWVTEIRLLFFYYLFIYLYRVSHEERTKLRESVPYVNLYRYNPKHLCPKLNVYWDNGQIKLWTFFGSPNDSCQLGTLIYNARLKCISLHMSDKPGDVTAQHSSVMYSTSNPMYYCTIARNFAVQINGFMSLTSYSDIKYRY